MTTKIKNFTLLEFFCALTIVVFIMSVCSVKIYKTVQKKRFFSEVQFLENSLQACHKLAVIYQEDTFCLLSQNDKGLSIEMGLSGGRGFLKGFAADTKFFPHLQFYFENKNLGQIDLGFSSTGKVFPEGSLSIFSKKKDLMRIIPLIDIVSVKDEIKSSK